MKNSTIYLLILILSLCCACGEPEEILVLDKGTVQGELHKAHVGKITFMNGYIPYEDYSPEKMLKSFDLTDDSNLNIRTFLPQTLTSYLHELAPELSVNDLCEKGNYQFSFYVDDKLIYKENLNTGAGSCSYRNSATVFTIPLASTNEEDSWGRFMWMRFMKKGGGEEALTAGKHQLKIEISPYVETSELLLGDMIAKGTLELNVIKENIIVDESQIQIQSIRATKDWAISNQKYDVEKIKLLNKKVAQKQYKDVKSIVIVKDEELLLEEYFNGADRATLHDTRSVGKSFVSALTGIALQEGHIKNTQQTLKDFYDLKKYKNYSIGKEEVTIEGLLNMTSGLEASDANPDSPGQEEKMYESENWEKFVLDLKMDASKKNGKKWDYISAGTVLLGNILHRATPNGLEKFAEEKLFQPLGINNYKWQYTPQGIVNTAGSLKMNALDLAKFGQLYKNGGTYKGKQILSKKWIDLTFDSKIELPEEVGGHYGYLFWNKTYTIDGKKITFILANGNGGNKIFIAKDYDLVVVITATAYNSIDGHVQADKMMEQFILPSILNYKN